ncbi:MAG: nicotinate-nucleotide pyrophosphorylase [Actinomycetota bacterium]
MARAAEPRLSDLLLGGANGARFRGVVTAGEAGIAAGLGIVLPPARAVARDGDPLAAGAELLEIEGTGAELARVEDEILGDLGVACGVATNAARLVAAAPEGLGIVCGGWKKLPAAMKPALRAGLAAAGVAPRLLDDPFVYIDKNAVRILGGLVPAIAAGLALGNGPVAVQIKDPAAALPAVLAGAAGVMVDTGLIGDVAMAHRSLVAAGLREGVTLALGGGVGSHHLEPARAAGADVVDVGRAILGAPLLDLRFDVDVV